MAYSLDLTWPRAKLKWAKKHIDILCAEVPKQSSDKGEGVALRGQFDKDQGAVIFYLESIIESKDEWSLMIGDVIHNLRSALDLLTWQLAIRHNKSFESSNPKIVRKIQFPIVAAKNDWPPDWCRKAFNKTDIAKLKKFQPFKQTRVDRARGGIHFLSALQKFSNDDKHRKVNPTYFKPAVFQYLAEPTFIDCAPLNKRSMFRWSSSEARKPGDEVFRIPVAVTGPNPNVQFDSRVTGYVALSEVDVIDALDAIANGVAVALQSF